MHPLKVRKRANRLLHSPLKSPTPSRCGVCQLLSDNKWVKHWYASISLLCLCCVFVVMLLYIDWLVCFGLVVLVCIAISWTISNAIQRFIAVPRGMSLLWWLCAAVRIRLPLTSRLSAVLVLVCVGQSIDGETVAHISPVQKRSNQK